MSIALPKAPDGEQYEDLVTATLKALGYFTEPRLTFREGTHEVLELDVVATPLGQAGKARQLFEAKKEAPSFSNVFKLFGQRMYLDISQACLVGLRAADPVHFPVYQAKGEELGIRICNYAIASPLETLATPVNTIDPARRTIVAMAAWYQQISRRICEDKFLKECKARSDLASCTAARTYLFNVRASFFQRSPLARAEALYSSYFQNPKLTGELIAQVATEAGISEKDAWNKVNDNDDWPWIQGLMQIETTARLRIIKNALDDVVERGGLPPPQTTLKIGSLSIDMPLHALPPRFHAGLELMRTHPHSMKLPYLFQLFSEVLGGFIFYNDVEELSLIESLTGIPQDQIVDCIRILDRFFASDGNSLFYTQKNQLFCMKMVPGAVRGGGAFLRKFVFKIEDYSAKYSEMGWLITKWHNALYRILEPTLGTAVP
jgi:hypothetical protein